MPEKKVLPGRRRTPGAIPKQSLADVAFRAAPRPLCKQLMKEVGYCFFSLSLAFPVRIPEIRSIPAAILALILARGLLP